MFAARVTGDAYRVIAVPSAMHRQSHVKAPRRAHWRRGEAAKAKRRDAANLVINSDGDSVVVPRRLAILHAHPSLFSDLSRRGSASISPVREDKWGQRMIAARAGKPCGELQKKPLPWRA
jgi:hypothetical protein